MCQMYTASDTFFATALHTHGMIHFVWSDRCEKHINGSFWLATEEFRPARKLCLVLTLQTKRITLCKRAWNSEPENGLRNCVLFCLRPLMPKERCTCHVNHQDHVFHFELVRCKLHWPESGIGDRSSPLWLSLWARSWQPIPCVQVQQGCCCCYRDWRLTR